MMNNRTKENGSHNNDWETPKYIYDFIRTEIGSRDVLFDPCPLNADFDGLVVDWGKYNYINPPYTRKLKEAFIMKAFEESKKGKLCIMLLPAVTDTKIFHDLIAPNAYVYLIKGRVKFKGHNSKGDYVTDKTGQSGSMFVIFDESIEPYITTVNLKQEDWHEKK